MGSSAAISSTVISGAASGYATYSSSRANSALLEWNARAADAQASDAIARGTQERAKLQRGTRRLIGAQRAALAAGGIDLSSGTAQDLVTDTQKLGEADAQMISNNAFREAWGYRVQAVDSRYRAGVARAEGIDALGATLLTTGAKTASFYYQSREGGGGGRAGADPGGYSNDTRATARPQGPSAYRGS